ncbi:hypothetical protein C0J52_18886 [Blattella germanica]|nr:hypothetical protein C0J52_18886 [Blattella germanica]
MSKMKNEGLLAVKGECPLLPLLRKLNLLYTFIIVRYKLEFFTPISPSIMYICEGELHSFHTNSSLVTLKNINFWTSQKNGGCNIALFLCDYSHFCMETLMRQNSP